MRLPDTPVAFLGPEGTFTALAASAAAPDRSRLPLTTIPDVVDVVRSGEVQIGVVPIENSIEGAVNLTLDTLAFGDPGVYIRSEITVPITMNLLARPGVELDTLKEVRSHVMAIPQCREWLNTNLPDIHLRTTASTARAAEEAAESDGTIAALGTTMAAERFGLDVLVPDIHDFDGNTTRFVSLGRRMTGPTGADKTSMVIFLGEDRPGLLMQVLDEFASRGINLVKIESRPTKQKLGEYCMFIDAHGHITEARMAEALRSVHRHVDEVKILGSYARADGVEDAKELADSEDAYAGAGLWFRQLLDRIE
ncbi:prephenate dehydratase [Euzebya tangerina]|uniref:prephenate dehydratase n=1 Tax=Euzebya tangerina TaxID=591198 RepID=UPI000E313ECC|nr:prephenate dehydratase [Euzebya tangerina]